MGEELKKTLVDIEPVDFVIEHVIDDINEIRNEITEEEEVTNKETLDYLDKMLELFNEFFQDYRTTRKKVKDNSIIIRDLSLITKADEIIEEEGEEKRGDMYS